MRRKSGVGQRNPLRIVDDTVEAASDPVGFSLLDARLVRMDEVPPQMARAIEGFATQSIGDARAGLQFNIDIEGFALHRNRRGLPIGRPGQHASASAAVLD